MDFSNKYISFHHTIDPKPNSAGFKMHTHEDCELYCFLSGKGKFYVEGNGYPLSEGDVLIMNTNESHYIEIDENYQYERCAVHFKKDFIRLIDEDGILLKPFEKRKAGRRNLYRKEDFGSEEYMTFIKNMIKNSHNQAMQIETNLLPFLNEISNAFVRTGYDIGEEDAAAIRRIIEYIAGNLNTPLSLDILCDKFYISKSQLCRIFKKTTGGTVWNYITTKRLMMAKSIIDNGGAPTEIYTKCGFSDYSVFFRAFKKYFGYSPCGK